MKHISKFFNCLAWAGLLVIAGVTLILSSPFIFIYWLFTEPMSVEGLEKLKEKIEDLKDSLNPDSDKKWFKEHKDMFDDED